MLLNDNVAAPLYRLPTAAYQTSYPILLADGVLSEHEALILSKFINQVQEINRGLEYAASANMNNDEGQVFSEYGRNRLKAETLMCGHDGQLSLFISAKAVVDRNISSPWVPFETHA